MADAPEHYVPNPQHPQPTHSTLEAVPYTPTPYSASTAGYTPNDGKIYYNPDGSQAPVYEHYNKEAQGYVQPSHAALNVEGAVPADAEKGNWKKRRICGLSMLVFIGIIVLLILAGIGAIVGGVVGTQNKNKTVDSGNAIAPPPPPTLPAAPSASSTTTSAAAPTSTQESDFKAEFWHRLHNNYLGPGKSLDIFYSDERASRKINMSTTGSIVGQSWQLMRIPVSLQSKTAVLKKRQVGNTTTDEPAPQYWIANKYLGQNIRVEVSTSDSIFPTMANADNKHLGQRWWAEQWADDGTWSLSNEVNGKGYNMSCYADTNRLFMADELTDSGQHWTIAQTNKIAETDWKLTAEELLEDDD